MTLSRILFDRSLLGLLHRYVGLTMAGFLLVAGLTGSLLAWNDELEAAVAPSLFRAPPPAQDAVAKDPLELRDLVQALHPNSFVAHVPLAVPEGRSLVFGLHALPDSSGVTQELANDQVFVHPYTGEVLGERKWGDITQGTKNLMPFVYRLHYTLALGVVGTYAFGIVALLWTLDCFVGAYLTLPARQHRSTKTAKRWHTRWWLAWKVRWGGGAYKVNFDVHRAGGLWPWAMLFVLAWSGVSFNLSEVYDPVMKALFAHQADEDGLPSLKTPVLEPVLNWRAARDLGRRLMAEQAQAHSFTVGQEDALVYDPRTSRYTYRVRSDRDVLRRCGETVVRFDGRTGDFAQIWLPTGVASGDTIRSWLVSLHMAAVWGLPFKVFVCVMGLAVASLSVTGVVIWWKKRQGRLRQAARAAALGGGADDDGAGDAGAALQVSAQSRVA